MLKVDDLVVGYGKAVVLKSVSLTISKTECVSVIGPNGAGKSTLLRALSGLITVISGTILFNGEPITGLNSRERVKRGLIQCPEGRMLFREMSVKENLMLGAYRLKRRGEVEDQLDFVYELFPILGEREKQQASTLSGGEAQMLAIGRALMARPVCLVMDEITLGLAPIVVSEVTRKLEGLKQVRISILLVEQNAVVALRVSDRCYVLENGHIVREGATSVMKHDETIRHSYLGL
jgi:branched-chain amino acid transport system ATP-binding protein